MSLSSEPICCPKCGEKMWEGVSGVSGIFCKKCGYRSKSSIKKTLDRYKDNLSKL